MDKVFYVYDPENSVQFWAEMGKRRDKVFLFQLLVKGLEPMLDKELEGKRMERGRDKDFYV
ncbi:hypothetical protein AAHB53_13225 [Niallia circulans]